MGRLTFLDICSGIGGFRLGLEWAGHKCVGYCEYDKFARASYEAMYDTEGEWKAYDVTELRPGDIPYADIWCYGFPCQDISIAGKQRGLRGKRSGIYYSIIDLIKGKEEGDKPTYLLVENVKNLLSVNAGFDFAAVLSEMDEAGYDVRWQVLNSKDFGVPQNRERVFLIAVLRSRGGREVLPVSGEDGGALKEVIGGMQGYRVYDPSGVSVSIGANGGGMGAKTGLYCVGDAEPGGRIFVDQTLNHPKVTEVARCLIAQYNGGLTNYGNSGVLETDSAVQEARAVLTPDRVEKRQNGRRMKETGEPMFTLTAQDQHGVYLPEEVSGGAETALPVRNATKQGYDMARPGDGIVLSYPKSGSRRGRVGKGCSQTLDTGCMMGTVTKCGKIRRLTPRECFRLQGFPDELYERAAAVNSETQLYKQAGNAVTATVAYAVAMALPESRELLVRTEAVWELFDVMTKGSGDARTQPLFFLITTAGTDRHSVCFEQHQKAEDILCGRKADPTFYPVIYGAEDDADWTSEEVWYRANPSLGHTIDIGKVRNACLSARDNPAEENIFRQLRLNQWVKQSTRWMQMEKWDACAFPVDEGELLGRECYGGLDLSSSIDITAFVLVFQPRDDTERYVFLPFFWIPEENMARRVRRDHVPYDVWEKQGFLETTEGDVIHYGFIESFIEDLGKRFHIKEIAFDRWGAVQMVQNLEGLGFTVVPFGQGFKDMSPPTKRLMELVLERNVAHGGHPVLRWMMDNIFVRTDPAGNIKPDKEKSTEKIDGAVAAVMALDRAVRHGGSTGSVYDERGILSF